MTVDLPGFDDSDVVRAKYLTKELKEAKIVWFVTDRVLGSSIVATKILQDCKIIEKVGKFFSK
jgi:hypothetical protein